MPQICYFNASDITPHNCLKVILNAAEAAAEEVEAELRVAAACPERAEVEWGYKVEWGV